ncbi:MAG: fatty-acid--CoA ligase [Segatella oris]|uniref:fatty-acid--CoA ligase n=1 Tax=Segatella oris TaxID=28135 RepID=UPI003FA23B33
MNKQVKKKCYVTPATEYFKMEFESLICSGSVRYNSVQSSEEEWEDGGTIIDETIEI